ncbi:hypothetical protein KDA06_00430 [Candidatus Saccharibacteria bacterium]|nr:hypothetical protein [Candidatus Saccharibacteria bacterium]
MSPYLEIGPIPTGQENILRWADRAISRSVGEAVLRQANSRPNLADTEGVHTLQNECEALARAMIDQSDQPHLNTSRPNPVDAHLEHMFRFVGHADVRLRHNSPPLLLASSRDRLVLGHTVAALVDIKQAQAIDVVHLLGQPRQSPDAWLVQTHDLPTGVTSRQTVTQVERGSGGEITLYVAHQTRQFVGSTACNSLVTFVPDRGWRTETVVMATNHPRWRQLEAIFDTDIGSIHRAIEQLAEVSPARAA